MYELISHQKISSATAEITFNSIPQIYSDLYLVVSARSSGTANNFTGLKINGTSNPSNHVSRFLYGTGSSVGTVTLDDDGYNLIAYMNLSSDTASAFATSTFYISNYRSSAAKSISIDAITENNGTAANQMIMAGLWDSTSAITSLGVISVAGSSLNASGTMEPGSSATLYGINRTSGRGRPKAIGGAIVYSNGYWNHVFNGSGTFLVNQEIEVDALVVAGGGGGGQDWSGGGGAGGFRTLSPIALSAGGYPVTVGSGGAGGPNVNTRAFNGSNSHFLGVISLGGGGGGSDSDPTGDQGAVGGSGGGGAIDGAGAAGTSGQGNSGSNGNRSNQLQGGGGGGAGAAASAQQGGAGLPWNGTYYAGGGGGAVNTGASGGRGLGGLGGGGQGSVTYPNGGATAGTANTGGGGGGNTAAAGMSGGSGVVIIRYRAD
jgi:hypothetical protein